MDDTPFKNPFRPGPGQYPPLLAGRQKEQEEFIELLHQDPVLKNFVLTGLRGIGKTVLLETLKPIAVKMGWLWAGTDLNDAASVSEANLAKRIITDISALVSSFTLMETEKKTIGYLIPMPEKTVTKLSYEVLMAIYNQTPGFDTDKIKKVLEVVWEAVKNNAKGIVLAYDEAQNLKDRAENDQYPLSVLLEVVTYLQKREIPYLLVLTGLPTLFPNLVDTRTYAERMFHVVTLNKLNDEESRQAIIKPIEKAKCPVTFSEASIREIIKFSAGYPYFIQFFCKEAYDTYLQQTAMKVENPRTSITEITRKLDTDFYAGRFAKVTDRQRDLLSVISKLQNANDEFTVQDIVLMSKEVEKPFSSSYINQMLVKLTVAGLIYKNRHGKYSFAVPLLADYINRQMQDK